ncbi:MAG TPA: hypothetical protein VMN43_00525 [Aestuariivirgaceae bacterium]|nr:hypothetical protein [Aestuariivirgaceae bacterium]
MTAPESLETIIDRVAGEAVTPEIQAMAAAVEARHEPGVAAVIAYGSAMRGVAASDTLIDLYVLTDSAEAVNRSRLARLGCRLVPPNVHYAEAPSGTVILRAKYAILPFGLFARKMDRTVSNPYFWARFSQPCRIVAARDDEIRRTLVTALAEAVRTMIAASLPLAWPGDDALGLWQRGLAESYRTELRPESSDRAREIVAANAAYYRAVTHAVLGPGWVASGQPRADSVNLRRRRIAGKTLSVLRLLKAAFTFEGGVDYVAWKIARHSGQAIEVRPWQRRHPVLGALWLLPGLLRRGVLR